MTTAARTPRSRRRYPWKTVTALVAALLIALAALFLRPSFFGYGEERITADTIEASFDQVAELSVEEYVYSNVGSYDKEGLTLRGFEVPFTGRNFLVTYDGTVSAGVRDVTRIVVDIDDLSRTITVRVPKVEVLSSTIDSSSVTDHDQSMNPLNQVRVDDVTRFISEQERLAQEKAVERGLLDRASARVEELLASHARAVAAGTSLDGYDVRVRWTS